MLGVVVQIDGWDPVAGAAVTLRAGSHDEPAVCHLDGQTWWPALAKLPVLRYDLFDGAFGAEITAPSSSLKLGLEPWPDFGRYALADARLRLWTGDVGQPWAAWTLRFDGRITEQPDSADLSSDISFAVDDRWLDQALLATYAGTTGTEGDAGLKGTPKPLALGAPRYVPGVLIDAVNGVFQISAYGPIEAVEAALEKLVRYGAPAGDYPTHAALVAATIPPGRWATCLAEGKARFGAPPAGQISFLVRGDRSGPDGWARLPGRLIRRLALLSGGAGKVHDASLAALDAARPYAMSLYLDQQTTARQLIQQLAASVNAVAGMSWTGQLFVVPVAIGAPAVTLAADGSALPPVRSVKQLAQAAPFKTLAIGAERAWAVHALSDIAFTAILVDMGTYAAGTTYREGNIVQYQGSTWLYINVSPTAGNAPPALPITEDDFWRVLAKAGAAGADGQDGVNGVDGADGQNGSDGQDGTDGADGADGADGVDGTDGFAIETQTPVFAIPCFSNGNPDPARWSGGSGSVRLRKGGAVIGGVAYAVAASSNVTSLAVNGGTGAYSFAGLTADTGFFVIRATYAGQAYDIKIDVKKVRDGSAAFSSNVAITTDNASASTTVPAGRTVRVSASAEYALSHLGSFTGRMHLYARNVTDDGSQMYLGSALGSGAYYSDDGNGNIEVVPGSVQAAFTFVSAPTDKLYQYSCIIAAEYGGYADSFTGSLALEVIA